MLKTILLMRHAEAQQGRAGQRDFDRCLTESGYQIARQTGICLKMTGLRIDRIFSSSAARTRQTAEQVASEVAPDSPLLLLDQLYNAPSESFVSAIRQESVDDDCCVLVVGHNPGIAGLMCQWSQQSLSVPPATVCIFQSEAPGWGELRLYSDNSPKLVCVVQEGRSIHKDPSFAPSGQPEI